MGKVPTRIFYILLMGFLISCNASEEKQTEAKSNPSNAEPQTAAEYVQQASFTDLEGNEVPISKFEGKVVMIDFWETWCKPCLASFPTLDQLQKEYPESFVVLAVTPGFTDTAEDARSFAQEHDYDFHYLMDSNNLHQKLGVQGIPYKVFVDPDGKFIKEEMGSSGPQADYRKVKKIIEEHKKS